MIDTIHLLVQIAAVGLLAVISHLIASGALRGPQGPQGPEGPAGPAGRDASGSSPAQVAQSGLVETLKRDGEGSWVHHGWVRAGSEAHEDALAKPGFAIRRAGEIHEGRQ